jgi:hypothetical protein
MGQPFPQGLHWAEKSWKRRKNVKITLKRSKVTLSLAGRLSKDKERGHINKNISN